MYAKQCLTKYKLSFTMHVTQSDLHKYETHETSDDCLPLNV